jgi:hypothetical protein
MNDGPALLDRSLRARISANTLKWERHGEVSRYSITQALAHARRCLAGARLAAS